jgi:hypothetical protein
LSGIVLDIYSYHRRSHSTDVTLFTWLAKNNVEFPLPYSNRQSHRLIAVPKRDNVVIHPGNWGSVCLTGLFNLIDFMYPDLFKIYLLE